MVSKNKKEEFILDGSEVLKKVKQLVKEGNVRRIIIKNEKDQTLMEVPLTWTAVGAVLAPPLAAIGAAAALLTKCKIVVEKRK
ncbi:hypothetical protein COU50_02745 [bacterium CG10_big_fil_rev_8_21_14_0_10_33_18]|nr:MAG: hypothetical protein COU50_02745 [bacterium CG10_big_fil_rev_8_21_14_0_10_33_18]